MKGVPLYNKPDFYIVTPRVPRQPPKTPNDITEMTQFAERLGFDRAWIIETNDRDAFSLATQMALATERILIGTNIVSVFSRTPTLLAMGAFTLDEVSGQRFILGIGPGGTEIISHGHGVPFEKPVARVREAIDIIRTLVEGKRLSYEGRFFKIQRDFRLRLGAERGDLPIYISAINPKMLELAGEKADGVILTHAPLEAAEDVKKHIALGAARAGRDPSKVHICSNQPVGVNHPEAALNLRKAIAWHLASRTFDWFLSHTPYVGLIERVRELWWSGRREEGARLIADEVLNTFGLGYRDEVIQERVKKYLRAGITPVLDAHGVRKGHEKEDTMHVLEVGISK